MDAKHLKTFYMLAPLISINYIKDLAISKEKLVRNASTETYFIVFFLR